MQLKELRNIFRNSLRLNQQEIDSIFYLLVHDYLGLSKLTLALEPQTIISSNNLEKFQKALVQLKKNTPIQYILGKTAFYGLDIKVNSNVLIPRPETEELVKWASSKITSNDNVLDICTGSGCIAITLAYHIKNINVSAIDISEKALKCAKENAIHYHLNIDFKILDILKVPSLEKNYYDIIISNPPYVMNHEKANMNTNVLNYEPSIALFVDDKSPLIFYDKIAQICSKSLRENGWVFFEINESLGYETKILLENYGFKHCQIRKDTFGKNRMICGQI